MKTLSIQIALSVALLQSTLANAADNANQIKRGEYLARASDCMACHTATHGTLFGGGFAVGTPFGKIWGTNISSDKQYGIGEWSDDQFVAAVREGIGRNGEQLYPAMPYDSFTKMKREDILAIKAYLMSLPAVHHASPTTKLPFPFNQRWTLRFWKWINLKQGELKNDPQHSMQWNNGRYLVKALAHCGTCHTPRNLTMGMDDDKFLAGSNLGGWIAYNITADKQSGIGNWRQSELVTYLKSGFVAQKASASGPMAEAIEHSLQYLPNQDLQDIATYLQTVKPIADSQQTAPRDSWGQPSTKVIALRGADNAIRARQPGAVLFAGNCASCHGAQSAGSGEGFHAYPSLYHHTTTGAITTQNLVSVILNGVHRSMSQGEIFMPGFAAQLNDQQVADLSNFISQQFGNPHRPAVTSKQVNTLRNEAKLAFPPHFTQGDAP